jgi:hypothetical protein
LAFEKNADLREGRNVSTDHELPLMTTDHPMRKPFDVLAEGPLLKYSRGDGKPLEFFPAGVPGLEARIGAMLRHQRIIDS